MRSLLFQYAALPAMFGVEVCWPAGEAIECRTLTVLARSHEEAAHLALDANRRTHSGGAEVVDVQHCAVVPLTMNSIHGQRG
jgi:hypothetical protein